LDSDIFHSSELIQGVLAKGNKKVRNSLMNLKQTDL